jgi:hypothetical protein
MEHIKKELDKYKGLSMQQFNHIKKYNVKEFESVGDLADEDNDILIYTDELGREVNVLANGFIIIN